MRLPRRSATGSKCSRFQRILAIGGILLVIWMVWIHRLLIPYSHSTATTDLELDLVSWIPSSLISSQSQMLPTTTYPNRQIENESFAACLVVMDDNHYLIEWLAYHYTQLPLTRLIVAVDPQSRTSPKSILQRYKNLINITIWNYYKYQDEHQEDDQDPASQDHNHFQHNDTMPNVPKLTISQSSQLTRQSSSWLQQQQLQEQQRIQLNSHRRRQKKFYVDCMKQLQIEHFQKYLSFQQPQQDPTIPATTATATTATATTSTTNSIASVPPLWTAIIDTDEYLTANRDATWKYHIWDTEDKTIYHLLQTKTSTGQYPSNHLLSSPCISIPRIVIGTKESSARVVHQYMPKEFIHYQNGLSNPRTDSRNSSTSSTRSTASLKNPQRPHVVSGYDLNTLRYIYHGDKTNLRLNNAAKCILDLSRVPRLDPSTISLDDINPHRPLKMICGHDAMWIKYMHSPYIIHHYIGTYSQWTFRKDPRRRIVPSPTIRTTTRTQNAISGRSTTTITTTDNAIKSSHSHSPLDEHDHRSREKYDYYATLRDGTNDDGIRDWLRRFLQKVGVKKAHELLQGAGQVQQ